MPDGVVGAAPFVDLSRMRLDAFGRFMESSTEMPIPRRPSDPSSPSPRYRRPCRGRSLRRWVRGLALLGSLAAHAVWAQPAVHWELQVIENGDVVDDFRHTTTLGQAYTIEASHASRHAIACPPPDGIAPASAATPLSFDLTRSITLSPIHLEANQIIFALDTRETVEDDATPDPRIDCARLPEPRVVTLHHPGLAVQAGAWTALTVIERDPSLIYRIKAEPNPP